MEGLLIAVSVVSFFSLMFYLSQKWVNEDSKLSLVLLCVMLVSVLGMMIQADIDRERGSSPCSEYVERDMYNIETKTLSKVLVCKDQLIKMGY